MRPGLDYPGELSVIREVLQEGDAQGPIPEGEEGVEMEAGWKPLQGPDPRNRSSLKNPL